MTVKFSAFCGSPQKGKFYGEPQEKIKLIFNEIVDDPTSNRFIAPTFVGIIKNIQSRLFFRKYFVDCFRFNAKEGHHIQNCWKIYFIL